MAKRAQKRAPARRAPASAEPRNPSRAAGEPAPASAAATRPGSFYDPGAGGSAAGNASQQSAAVDEGALAQVAHADQVRRESVPLDGPGTADASLSQGIDHSRQDLAAEIERIRATRKPLGAFAQKLALDRRPGYHRHWFNDTGNRVSEAESNGWSFVKDQENRPIRRAVGTGRDNGVQYAYAMEIPEVFWQEDMAARHADAQSRLDALKAAPVRAQKGQAEKSDSGKFYSPVDDMLSVEKGA